MLKSKIASMALATIMTIGATGVTAFAAEPVTEVDTTPVSIMNETRGSGMTLEDFLASGHTLEGLKDVKGRLDEKGITLEEAKANMGGKIQDFADVHGITLEEAQAQLKAFKESGKSIDGLQSIKAKLEAKGISLEEAKANFSGMLNELATARGVSVEEAKAKISEMKEAGKTLKGLKNLGDKIGNIPLQ